MELRAIADSALSHPDAHAGSVSIQTQELVEECLKLNPTWEYKMGTIQGVLLAATEALNAERTKLIKGDEPINDPHDPDDTEIDPSTPPTQPPQSNNLASTHDVGAFAAVLSCRHQQCTYTQQKQKKSWRAAQGRNSNLSNPPKRPRTKKGTGIPNPPTGNGAGSSRLTNNTPTEDRDGSNTLTIRLPLVRMESSTDAPCHLVINACTSGLCASMCRRWACLGLKRPVRTP